VSAPSFSRFFVTKLACPDPAEDQSDGVHRELTAGRAGELTDALGRIAFAASQGVAIAMLQRLLGCVSVRSLPRNSAERQPARMREGHVGH
jgi:hypothetical protein